MSFQMNSSIASPFGTSADERLKAQAQPTFRPLVASSPGGYQQTSGSQAGAAPGQNISNPPVTAFAASTQQDSYFPQMSPPGSSPQQTTTRQQPDYAQHGQAMDGLTQHIGGMDLDGSAAPQQHRRKKDRHAYHQLEQPTASFSSGPTASPSQFLSGQPAPYQPGASPNAAPWQQTIQAYQSQTITPAMNQFPAEAGTSVNLNPQDRLQGAPSAQGKVNPDQVPSVPVSRDLPAEYYKSHVYPTMEQHLPPPSTTPCVAFDQGNASPKHARLTLNCIPTSHEQLASTGLPLGLVLQPLAKQADGEQAIPVLDFGDTGPPRCRRCRAYINPFMTFSHGGNRMTCNLCSHPNEVDASYFAPTDPSGVRVDRQQRPELMLGTCEFLVPKEYWAKEPTPIRYLFLIDVTLESAMRGWLQGICDGILASIYGEDVGEEASGETNGMSSSKLPEGATVAIVSFDRTIHFYNLSSSLPAAQQLIVSDLDDPFPAISPSHLFVDPTASRSNIVSLLRRIPEMFSTINHPEPALLPALNAGLSALADTGGKIIASLSSLSTHGPGRLFLRDKGTVPSSDSDYDKNLLKTEYVAWLKTSRDMVKAGVGVDFFLAAPAGGYLDIATIGHVSEKGGGETFYCPNWSYPRDALRLKKELCHTVQREQGYAALMKVRCSNGLQISNYSGAFTQHTFGADLELASITEDTGMGVTFAYDGKLDSKLDAHFQSALLYTTSTGQRRVRCSNLVASVTEHARESMKFVDQDAVLTVMAKEAAAKISERSTKDIRNALQEKTIDILAGYRKNFSGSHPPGQLVLPENLKEFSMYMLGLIKSRALKGGKEPSDRRIFEARLLKQMGPCELSWYLYPRILALHNLDETEGFADESGHLKMPHAIRASFGQIEQGGVYLVDNGQILLLWLHAQVSPNLLEDLFGEGLDSLTKLDLNLNALPVLETHLNAQVRNILLHMETQRGSKGLAIQLARQGLDGAEYEFARLLYEDRNGEASSYVDWLVMLHRGVGLELNGQRTKGDGSGDVAGTISNTISSITGSVPYWG